MGIMKRIYTEAGSQGRGSLKRFSKAEQKAIQVLLAGCLPDAAERAETPDISELAKRSISPQPKLGQSRFNLDFDEEETG